MRLRARWNVLWQVMRREWSILTSRPLYLFCMVVAPLFCYMFFTTLMSQGLPQNLPTGVVDLDATSMSRRVVRNLDAMPQTQIVAHYASVGEARTAVQRGDIYGFFYLPNGFSSEAQAQRRPMVSFYTNYAYLIPGSLLFRDMKMLSEMTSAAATRSVLYARGATDDQAMDYLRPIVIDTHALGNPWLNYSIYLTNTILPGVLCLLIFMVTVCSIGIEIKSQTSGEWLEMSGGSVVMALTGKLLPQTLIFMLMGVLYNVYLYGYLDFPCASGIGSMLAAMALLVLAAQALGIVIIALLPTLRLGLSLASLWGVISLSIAGFSFPVLAMPPMIKALSVLFPLRHYFLIYVQQALHGYGFAYSWPHYVALMLFLLLPLLVIRRLHRALLHHQYTP